MTTSGRSSTTASASARLAAARAYRLFGITLASDFDFASALEPARGPADVRFTLSESAPLEPRLGEPVFTSPFEDEGGESLAHLYRLPEGELLRFDRVLDFYLLGDTIHCHLRDPRRRFLVELRLLGPVLAFWLERRAVLALHASAVVVEGRAIAFLAANQGGKTGLAASLMTAGWPLLSDDLLPIAERDGRFAARPGYPQMRMWPDEAEHFLGDVDGLDRVHPELGKLRVPVGAGGMGEFHPGSAPPACLYVPERRPPDATGGVAIEPLAARRAVMALVRCSFSPFLVEAVGLQAGRLELFARLARAVPVRRLVYPSGFDRLPEVGQAVLDDCAAL